jgi:integral membrane protein (TIGR01906 family)
MEEDPGVTGVRRVFSFLAALAVGLALPVVAFLLNVEIIAYHREAYRSSFLETGAAAVTGISVDRLEWVIIRTVDYATGRREDLQFDRAEVDGGPVGRPALSRTEITHMADVRDLFQVAATARRVALGVVLLGALTVILLDKRRAAARLGRGLGLGTLVFMGAGAGLAAALLTGFGSFWTTFHEILFSNDLWLLPEDSLLIQMLPEPLFQRLALEIVGLLAVELAGILGLSLALARRGSRRNAGGDRLL